jgi:tetratricopeptide (TPR) repeat protein
LSFSAAHLRLGCRLCPLRSIDKAAEELDILLKEDPENVQGRYLLALIYTTKKDYDRAAKEYEKILTSFRLLTRKILKFTDIWTSCIIPKKIIKKRLSNLRKFCAFEPYGKCGFGLSDWLFVSGN